MEKLLKNKKILIVGILVLILAIVMVAYVFVSGMSKNPGNQVTDNPPVENVSPDVNEDMYITDENGNIKNEICQSL